MSKMPDLLYSENDYQRKVDARKKTGDGRSAFGRDWARLVHSPCFRRLQGKTQLFPSDESDFYRNRLTHSLEVAQIASGIAINLNENHDFFQKNDIDIDLVFFAGLAHDLGHPPFGHNGENALDRLMARYGGFEGNAQTLRILARLEKKATDTYPQTEDPNPVVNNRDKRLGLNATFRSLASILKYDKPIPQIAEDRSESQRKKPVKGYYFTEAELVSDIKKYIGVADSKDIKTIECSIMDLADDIAYSTYDLEDSLKAGFISPLKILAYDNKFKERIIEKINDEIDKNAIYGEPDKAKHVTLPEFDKLVVETFEDMLNEPLNEIELSEFGVTTSGQAASASELLCENGYFRGEFTSKLVHEFMDAIKVDVRSPPQLSRVYLDIEKFKKVELLKRISFETIISSPRLKMA